ncbi:VOC family protein [Natranaeroarchaeum aerophilus]|uniref:VOC family protein n=1 Tax=Natranaeroarchaeum aerophilus TaxID=2917711 RepID=A0AAE3K656_9EURY|nr:VOC family protein [Natranaeroarchaeum aerophilus]MCL9814571.1 VOC family protein [Natranaeroarchaeum aerophilus]
MLSDTPGIHHVTGLVGDAQESLDFYVDVLGLRSVKRTVNFEDILQYHLYFGDEHGTPGSVFTVFPDPHGDPGRVGVPQIRSVGFAIPEDAVGYWRERLVEHDVETTTRFDETAVRCTDPHGTEIELVTASSSIAPWDGGSVPSEHGIRGLHGVTLLPTDPYATAGTLETLGFEFVGQETDRIRYRAAGDRATVIDILDRDVPFGREGAGTIHHVAVRVESEAQLYEWRELFADRDYTVSRVKDRHFFRSLYVRGPGGILFELATETPGVTAGEDPDSLGESLFLPDWFEEDRELIESQLPELTLPDKRET